MSIEKRIETWSQEEHVEQIENPSAHWHMTGRDRAVDQNQLSLDLKSEQDFWELQFEWKD